MITLLEGDCRVVLATLPDASVHMVCTSPPYFGLRDYQVAGQIGLEATPDEYVAQLVAVFREVRRVLRDDGTCWVVIGDSYSSGGRDSYGSFKPDTKQATNPAIKSSPRPAQPMGIKPKDLLGIPWMVAFALRDDGWYLRSDIIWQKLSCMPESVTDRPTSSYEHVFLLAKSVSYFYDAEAIKERAEDRISGNLERIPRANRGGNPDHPGGQCGHIPYESNGSRNARNVWTINPEPYSGAHFAVFPTALAERCIKAGTSERGCCANCGAPWARVTERTAFDADATIGPDRKPLHAATYSRHKVSIPGGQSLVGGATRTIGWSPSCQCNAATVPATVLDCFGGAGTTGLVAARLRRDAILIELNADYARMAQDRIDRDMLVRQGDMFLDVAAE